MALREAGVEATIGTWHIPLLTHYRRKYGYRPGNFPVADDVFARSLSLPLYEGLTPADQEYVVESVDRCLQAIS
jgi:dTDP-4-amino-4,6-dideoxygalactose transaminase